MALLSAFGAFGSLGAIKNLVLNWRVWVAVIIVFCLGFGIWKIQNQGDQIQSLTRDVEQRQEQVDSLTTRVDGAEKTISTMKQVRIDTDERNARIEKQVRQNSESLRALRENFNSIDIDKSYAENPEETTFLLNALFEQQIDCIEANANGIKKPNC